MGFHNSELKQTCRSPWVVWLRSPLTLSSLRFGNCQSLISFEKELIYHHQLINGLIQGKLITSNLNSKGLHCRAIKLTTPSENFSWIYHFSPILLDYMCLGIFSASHHPAFGILQALWSFQKIKPHEAIYLGGKEMTLFLYITTWFSVCYFIKISQDSVRKKIWDNVTKGCRD